MVIAAMHGIVREVVERVVHPPRAPLAADAEAGQVCEPGHRWKLGRLLRDGVVPRSPTEHHGVDLLQEMDRLEVLATTERVRHPLPGLARVVEVEHRRYRIDP